MQPKRGKYDTNPLEEDVAQRAGDSFSQPRPDPTTEEVRGVPTRDVGPIQNEARFNPATEAETRPIGDHVTSYPSVFVPPKTPQRATYEPPRVSFENIYQPPPVPPPGIYQSPQVPLSYPTGTHKVGGLGIPEKWAVMLPYLPFSYLGIVAAIIELALVPRTESRVRFHAAQALGLQLGITVISILLTFAGVISGRSAGAGLFNFASFIFLIIAMIRVWKGKPLNLPPLDEPRKWLDEKIKPRN